MDPRHSNGRRTAVDKNARSPTTRMTDIANFLASPGEAVKTVSSDMAQPVIGAAKETFGTGQSLARGQFIDAGIHAMRTGFDVLMGTPGAQGFNVAIQEASKRFPKATQAVMSPLSAISRALIAHDFETQNGRKPTDQEIDERAKILENTPIPGSPLTAAQALEMGDTAINLGIFAVLHKIPTENIPGMSGPGIPGDAQGQYRDFRENEGATAAKAGEANFQASQTANRQENVRESPKPTTDADI